MWKKAFVCLSLVVVFYGCNFQKKETSRLQTKVDSLADELQKNQHATTTLLEVGILMDSIDANRNALHTRMIEGTTFDDYVTRMKGINHYVKEAQIRIAFLEERVKSTKISTSSYTGTIGKLRGDLELRSRELTALKTEVDRYRNQNDNLIHTVDLQKAEIADKLNQIKSGEIKIDTLEREVNLLLAASKIDQAEAYYARARAVEETANRTKFAPRKRRDTRKEALELYKMAVFYGKQDAQEKVTELEKKI